MAKFGDRLKHAWNAFTSSESVRNDYSVDRGEYWSMGGRPDRPQLYISNERSIISSIYTRMSIDCAAIQIRHVRTDDQDRYIEDIDSALNNCLTIEANIDQAARHFRQDVIMTLFDRGCAAIVPVDTTLNPLTTGGYDIQTMRVGEIMMWYPKSVRVSVYNEATGLREEITLPKSMVAIVENPLYSVMNEPNSTLQRLIRKLSLLDTVDEQQSSGKLDLIIQLPYVIKSESRRAQAEQRRKDVEFQLKGSQYGIAYTDGTEKITQLNRPAENNLLVQIDSLTKLLYVQLGLTPEVMDGTADEKTMLNYLNRTVEPVMEAIVESMKRTFLTKTARTQKQTIKYFRDPFKLIPLGGVGGIADIADKLARNEIMSSNELRQVLWLKPDPHPKSDQLVNSNMPQADTGVPPANGGGSQFNDQVQQALAEADKAMGVTNGSTPGG
jgi:Phage portal protein